MYQLLRPILFAFDAERAHDFALDSVAWLAEHPMLCQAIHDFAVPANPPISVAGLSFPSRVGLAAGLDKNARAPLAWWAFGFGFLELGTITPRPQAGNPKPRSFRDVPRRALRNRMGFNNDGMQLVADRLQIQLNQKRRPPIPIGISVGKNATTPLDQAIDDYVAAAQTLEPFADFLSLNVSSPNTTGLRSLQNEEFIRSMVRQVKAVGKAKPLFVKVAPELEGDALASVVSASLSAGATGIIATNTLAQFDAEGKPIGGLSGRPLQNLARKRISEIRRLTGDTAVLIGAGGIDSIVSARAMLDAGADLLQIYSGLVYEGPFLAAKIARGLAHHSRALPPRAGQSIA